MFLRPKRPRTGITVSRPLGLVLLVTYKALLAVGLLVSAIALNFFRIRHAELVQYTLYSHRAVVTWLLDHLTQISPDTLAFGTIAAGLYAAISGLEAVGLWYEQAWARWLLLISVGLSWPFEVLELARSMSFLKVLVLGANILAFWYVLRRFPQHS